METMMNYLMAMRDPIDPVMPLEHHFLRQAAATPFRLFSELDMDNNNLMNSIEKARILHQQWSNATGRSSGYPTDPNSPSSLHHLLAAANSAAAAAAAASVPSLPQLYTLNPTRGSPSPLPLPAHLWSQWSALSQLPPGLLGQAQHLQGPPGTGPSTSPHQSHNNLNISTSNGGDMARGGPPVSRSLSNPINLRYSPYPMPAKSASTSPNSNSSLLPSPIPGESANMPLSSTSRS